MFPPTKVMNDFIAGYMGAAGVTAALIRRAREGGSYHVKINLTRNAMWYPTLGLFDRNNLDMTGERVLAEPGTAAEPVARLDQAHRVPGLDQLARGDHPRVATAEDERVGHQ